MANRIVELAREPIGGGRVAFRLLYLYPVNPVVEIDGQPVILTPRDELPDGVEDYGLLTGPELTALGNGTGAFRPDRIKQRSGETPQQVLDRAQRRYAIGLRWLASQRIRYANTGERYDEA